MQRGYNPYKNSLLVIIHEWGVQLVMCAAIVLNRGAEYNSLYRSYSSGPFQEKFAGNTQLGFAYWDPHPLLPVRKKDEIVLFDWGHRDGDRNLPKTGWARLESLSQNAWDRYNPIVVRIPAHYGCEKKVWFAVQGDIRGILIREGNYSCVYMITQEATEAYKALTKHARMPRFHDGPNSFSVISEPTYRNSVEKLV